ncbi:MAG: hypothetical protein MZU91_09015 [Desulfosudis oleivorans]|nr:hypothetical protein [Desulfosudis oleivorans]
MLLGDRILVERKTARDFVDTLINRDLLGQVKAMAESVTRPVMIIEGGDLYAQRDMHPNAIKGVLAALTVDMGVSILFTRDEQDTAQMLFVLSKREDGEPWRAQGAPEQVPSFPARGTGVYHFSISGDWDEECTVIVGAFRLHSEVL